MPRDLSLYGFGGLTQAFNVHPACVHFPIALLPVALLFYTLGLAFRKTALLVGGRVCLCLAVLAVMAAVITGYNAQNTVPHNERIHHLMSTHRNTGLIVLGLTVLLPLWSFWQTAQRPQSPPAFLLVTARACYFALQNGDLGSRRVFWEGAAVKPAVPVIGVETHEHHQGEDEHHPHPP